MLVLIQHLRLAVRGTCLNILAFFEFGVGLQQDFLDFEGDIIGIDVPDILFAKWVAIGVWLFEDYGWQLLQ